MTYKEMKLDHNMFLFALDHHMMILYYIQINDTTQMLDSYLKCTFMFHSPDTDSYGNDSHEYQWYENKYPYHLFPFAFQFLTC